MRAGNDFHTTIGWARLPMLVAGFSLASILAATAQTPPADEDPDMAAAAEEAAAAPDVNDADIMKDIDVSKLDWSLLNTDPSTLAAPEPKKSAAAKGADSPDSLVVVQRQGRTAPPRCRSSNPSRRSGTRGSAPT